MFEILSEDIKATLQDCVERERKTGKVICCIDNYDNDLQRIADIINIPMIYDKDQQKMVFFYNDDRNIARVALNYYYTLHF